MTDFHCDNCEFLQDKSNDNLIDGYCKKYNQSLTFYDWFEKCDKCIEEGKMTELEYLKQQEEKNAEAALRENARLEAEVERLQAENAALRKQISEMVMPPCTLGDTLYIVVCTFGDGYVEDEIVHQGGFGVVKSVVTEKNFYKMCDLVRNGKAFFSREAAEARLVELNGGKK